MTELAIHGGAQPIKKEELSSAVSPSGWRKMQVRGMTNVIVAIKVCRMSAISSAPPREVPIIPLGLIGLGDVMWRILHEGKLCA